MASLWWSGARSTALPTATGERLMREMLLPSLGYGGELARLTKAQERKLESVQGQAGCQLLGLPRWRTSHAMVRGELGWMTMRARRHAAQLRFAHRVQAMPPTLLTRAVYDERRQQYDQRQQQNAAAERRHASKLATAADADGDGGGGDGSGGSESKQQQAEKKRKKQQPRARTKPQHGLHSQLQQTLATYGLSHPPDTSGSSERAKRRSSNRWARAVDRAVLEQEKKRWWSEMSSRSSGKSPWYASVKQQWGRESWLDGSDSIEQASGRRWRVRMRCSSGLPLAAVLHAEDKRQEERR